MTLIATIFEKCTGSNACESFKYHPTTNATNTTNTNTILEQTIAENEARIAELVKKIEAMDARIIEMEEEAERTGVIEDAYRKLEIEYKVLGEEADAITARNSRISSALRAAQSVGAGDDVAMNDLRSQIIELVVVIDERNELITDHTITIATHLKTIATHLTTITDYTDRFNDLKAEYEELALKYHVLTHTHHSGSAVEIIVPGLTYKPEIAEYVRLYGFPEDFVFDDAKLDAILWNLCEDGGGMGGVG